MRLPIICSRDSRIFGLEVLEMSVRRQPNRRRRRPRSDRQLNYVLAVHNLILLRAALNRYVRAASSSHSVHDVRMPLGARNQKCKSPLHLCTAATHLYSTLKSSQLSAAVVVVVVQFGPQKYTPHAMIARVRTQRVLFVICSWRIRRRHE